MGIPSFRVRGMYLAIVTLAFANAAYAWLFHQRIFNGGRDASRYEPDHLRIGSLDLSDRRTYYLVCLAALVTIVLMANRLRRSGVGRALVAVRDNEPSAAAFTIAPRATKLSAFALAGGLAGFAGALLMALRHQRPGRPVPGRHVAVGRLDGRDRRSGVGGGRRHRHAVGRRAAGRSSAPTRPSACSPRASGCSC